MKILASREYFHLFLSATQALTILDHLCLSLRLEVPWTIKVAIQSMQDHLRAGLLLAHLYLEGIVFWGPSLVYFARGIRPALVPSFSLVFWCCWVSLGSTSDLSFECWAYLSEFWPSPKFWSGNSSLPCSPVLLRQLQVFFSFLIFVVQWETVIWFLSLVSRPQLLKPLGSPELWVSFVW